MAKKTETPVNDVTAELVALLREAIALLAQSHPRGEDRERFIRKASLAIGGE